MHFQHRKVHKDCREQLTFLDVAESLNCRGVAGIRESVRRVRSHGVKKLCDCAKDVGCYHIIDSLLKP